MLELRSAFLWLPRELRDHIYEYLLTRTFLVKVPHTGRISSSLQLHQHTHLAVLNVKINLRKGKESTLQIRPILLRDFLGRLASSSQRYQ